MTELAPRSHDDIEPAPITDLLDFPVEKFWPVLRRFTSPAASAHFIELVLTPPPNTPAPYGQTRFTFTLYFSEPGAAPPEAERLFSLFLPSAEFPTWMLTLSSAPTTLSLSVNLAQSVIVNAYLSPTNP